MLYKYFCCFYWVMDTVLNTADTAINKASCVCVLMKLTFQSSGCHLLMDGILAPHRETRKSIVATNLLFENTLFIFLICHSNSGQGICFSLLPSKEEWRLLICDDNLILCLLRQKEPGLMKQSQTKKQHIKVKIYIEGKNLFLRNISSIPACESAYS